MHLGDKTPIVHSATAVPVCACQLKHAIHTVVLCSLTACLGSYIHTNLGSDCTAGVRAVNDW